MWEDTDYCWVVLCKNHWFHVRQNLFFRHRIPLAPTDAVAPLPSLDKAFTVRCDECGKTYTYKAKDVLRVEVDLPESFRSHPLFREEAFEGEALADSSQNAEHESPWEEPLQDKQKRAKGA